MQCTSSAAYPLYTTISGKQYVLNVFLLLVERKREELIALNQFLPPPDDDVELRQHAHIVVVPEGIPHSLREIR